MDMCRRPGLKLGSAAAKHVHAYIDTTTGLKAAFISQPLAPLYVLGSDARQINGATLSSQGGGTGLVLGVNTPHPHARSTRHDHQRALGGVFIQIKAPTKNSAGHHSAVTRKGKCPVDSQSK